MCNMIDKGDKDCVMDYTDIRYLYNYRCLTRLVVSIHNPLLQGNTFFSGTFGMLSRRNS